VTWYFSLNLVKLGTQLFLISGLTLVSQSRHLNELHPGVVFVDTQEFAIRLSNLQSRAFVHDFHRARVLLFSLEIEGSGRAGAFNLVIRVVEGLDLLAEEGVGGEVLRLLFDIVGLLLAYFHAFGLVVEEFEENASKSFNFVDCAGGVDFGMLR
jgi:hypothetical protein